MGKETLREYRRKRDFRRTPEPPGGRKGEGGEAEAGKRYLVQMHDARRLHFDFRLELDGVLKSWAVTKGPSLDPADKRLAVRTEDHPLEYGDFEGVIPEGYGAGTVLLWDTGTWHPQEDPRTGLEKGALKFELRGKRLRGGYALVRMRGRRNEKRESWLLVKERDRYADPDTDPIEKWTDSIETGLDLAGVAEDERGRDSALHGVRLTRPDRVMYPEQGMTKRRLAEHYARHADVMLPYLAGRPLSLVRCPDGRSGGCFYQKHPTASLPEQLGTIDILEKGGAKKPYLIVRTPAGLVATAQIGALELHVWGAREDRLDRPERLVFDLDPGEGAPFRAVREAAAEVRDMLDSAGLQSFPMLSGGKGVHVIAPLVRRHGWDEVQAFAEGVARTIASGAPERYLANASKAQREGKVFIDWLRNQRGATAVAPYSPRARSGAPVATPIRWDELGRIDTAARYTLETIGTRLARVGEDPWDGYFELRQSLRKAVLERFSNASRARGRRRRQ